MPEVRPMLVYVVDDDPRLADALRRILTQAGWEAQAFTDGGSGVKAVTERVPDALMLDLMLPDINGLEVLRRVREIAPNLPVVMLSGQGSIKAAVEALRLGAYDFLEKPPDANRIRVTVSNAIERGRLARQVAHFKAEVEDRFRMIGESAAMRRVRELIARAAPTTASVLVTGESGVGKELVARALHLQSLRSDGPFVALNCAAISRDIIESELFGHEKGSFTGASAQRKGRLQEADTGTLFLDEIGDMSLAAQAKLLRFLENAEVQRVGGNQALSVDARVVAATNKDLPFAVKAGSFREDLYHRLNVVAIRVPPLRERRDDIPALVEFFLDRYSLRHNRRVSISQDGVALLAAHEWPGNVRELRNLLERVVVLAEAQTVDVAELKTFLDGSEAPVADGTLKAVVDEAERHAVQKALAEAHGNITAAARLLGIERPSLHRILKRLGIAADAS